MGVGAVGLVTLTRTRTEAAKTIGLTTFNTGCLDTSRALSSLEPYSVNAELFLLHLDL